MGNNLSKFKPTTQQLVDKYFKDIILGEVGHTEGYKESYRSSSIQDNPHLGKEDIKRQKQMLERLLRQGGYICD